MAADDASKRKPAAWPDAVYLNRVESILRASGQMPAARPDHRRNHGAVKVDRRLRSCLQELIHGVLGNPDALSANSPFLRGA